MSLVLCESRSTSYLRSLNDSREKERLGARPMGGGNDWLMGLQRMDVAGLLGMYSMHTQRRLRSGC